MIKKLIIFSLLLLIPIISFANGGDQRVLELKYTFESSGLHEIFFDFAFASNPQKIYEAFRNFSEGGHNCQHSIIQKYQT